MNKRTGTIKHAVGNGPGDVQRTGVKGPARTTPKHGKVNRLPYDAPGVRRKMLGMSEERQKGMA